MNIINEELKKYLLTASEAADQARSLLLNYYGRLSKIERKKMAGLVSEADKESEKLIADHVLSKVPGSVFYGEEGVFEQSKSIPKDGLCWVVDPLDGTTNYVHQFHIFCISIALLKDYQPVVGLIDVPMLDHRYVAVRDEGAYLNGKKISVSDTLTVSDSLIATGFFADDKPALKEQLRIFNKVVRRARGVRRSGVAAYDLCMVAQGIFDGFWEKNLKPWDTAAGHLLVEEAGGMVTTYDGEDFHATEKSILASNKCIHNELLKSF